MTQYGVQVMSIVDDTDAAQAVAELQDAAAKIGDDGLLEDEIQEDPDDVVEGADEDEDEDEDDEYGACAAWM